MLVEWKRVAENDESGPVRKPTSRPASARVQTGLNPPTARKYSLNFNDMDTTSRARDYRSRVSAGASTLTDSVGVFSVIKKVSAYSPPRAWTTSAPILGARATGARTSGVPLLNLARSPSTDLAELSEKFDYDKFEVPHHAQDVMRVSVRPSSASLGTPRAVATSRLQRPASARMASSRDDALAARLPYTPHSQWQSTTQRPMSARAVQDAALIVRKWDRGHPSFSELRVTVPTDLMLDAPSPLNDHLRWLSGTTCGELVDAVCRRPHEELAHHVRRLQDHLQIFGIFSNTFNSRNELERQHASIQRLHE